LSNPLQDGKPLLEGAAINNAQLAGDVLAVSMSRTGERLLVLFRGSTNAVLGQLRHPIRQPYALSPDGRYLAHRDAAQAVVVSECSSPATSLATASRVKLHNNLEIRLRSNPFQLIVAIGTFGHTFSVFEGRLRYSLALGWDKFPDPKGSTVRCHLVDYDSSRFPPSEVTGDSPWKAVVDCLGQILLLAGKEMIAAFLIRRDRAAAWIPGGIFWGDIGLIGGPPSPDAEAKIGRAIMTAAVCNLGA
jgi:MoxR-vWA-beta-propeller ternary system domain bpX1